MQIKFSRNFARTELLEVGREPLRVEQGESPFAQTLNQRPERDLRPPRRAMKHRLAEKGATNRAPVRAADEFVSRPDLDRMRGAELVQTRIAFDDLIVDPGVGTRGTAPHHLAKVGVDPNLDRLCAKLSLQPMWHMKSIERQNRARVGEKPADLAVVHRHGKTAEPIPFQEEVGIN